MYHFSAWKYWLVIAVMVVGLIFFLPNVFGEDPALQVVRQGQDHPTIDAAGEEKIRSILKEKAIPISGSFTQDGRLVLRFENEDEQRKAREALLAGTNRKEFGIAQAFAPRTPDFLRKIGLKPMSLGLDLRGGVRLLYEVDLGGVASQSLERIERDVRSLLRDRRITYGNVVAENDSLRVVLRDPNDLQKAIDEIRKQDADITVDRVDSPDGASFAVRLSPQQLKQRQDLAIEQNITTLRRRIDELGVSEPIVTRQGLQRVELQLPGMQDPNEAIRILGTTASVEFRLVDEANDPLEAERTKRVPISSKLYKMRVNRAGVQAPILLKREIIASGDQLTDASTGFQEGRPAVTVKLDGRAGDQMLKTTQQNLGHRMAVVYIQKKQLSEGETCDGKRVGTDCTEEEVISDAIIQGVFSTRFQITGLGALEARDLALLLRAGSLATPLKLVEQRTVGPSLGKDNIERGKNALIVGLLLTFAFMAVYYRAFGWIANAVLLSNLILTVGLLSMMQASLSLPGIAAVVFHLGIAVDANILIYERIREELRLGNSPQAAINAGFEKAFATIADSNVTTLIAGVVLLAMGSGTIRSFAIVMTIGIVTSLFTSVVGSRALVHYIWGRRKRIEKLSI